MAVGDVYRLSVVGTALDQTIVNTFHFLQTASLPSGQTTPTEILFRWQGGPGNTPMTRYGQIMPALWTARELNVINVSNPLDNGSAQVALVGSRGSTEILPPQCCALLSLRTQGLGRSYRGRTYLGPVLENDQVNGTITASYSTAIELFVNAVRDSYNSSPLAWVIYSRKLGTSQPVSRIIIRLFIATQRRRSRYNPG